ncbi:MAG: peroxidase family protein [Mycobacterium sp.]
MLSAFNTALETAVEGLPTTLAVPAAPQEPSPPSNPVSDVVRHALAGIGLSPFTSDDPQFPNGSPALLAVLAWARRKSEEEPSTFGRMFPVGENSDTTGGLEPLNQLTDQQLADLAQTMLEEEPTNNPKGTAAGLTFFGQFIDHDLTLDQSPQPSDTVDVEGLVNDRTFSFDLDSVYGGGLQESPQLYDGDKFLIGTATDGVSPDLPRNTDGSAIIADPRNDENLIISQIQLSFLRLHNSLVDQGLSFDKAQQTVVGAYQNVVLNDYLPQIVGQEAVDQALSQSPSSGFYQPGSKDTPVNPVEFSTAAFRFGHSQVRNGYAINDAAGGPVFSADPAVTDLRGGSQLPSELIIDFNNFFSELPRDSDEDPAQLGMAIDTEISESLFNLPIPGAAGSGSNVLAFRNLVRAKFYDLPSGEAIAEEMGVPVVGEPVFPEGTPLWYYVLREAELTSGGAELGPVGGAIVAEVFVDLLRLDGATKNSREPRLPDASGGDFQIGDLLVAADLVEEQQSPAPAPHPRHGPGSSPKRSPDHQRPKRHRIQHDNHAGDRAADHRSWSWLHPRLRGTHDQEA